MSNQLTLNDFLAAPAKSENRLSRIAQTSRGEFIGELHRLRGMFETLEMQVEPDYLKLEAGEKRDALRNIAFMGQKFADYIDRILTAIDGSRAERQIAQDWVNVISRHNYGVIDKLFGEGKAAALREAMIALGEDGLHFAAQNNKPRPRINAENNIIQIHQFSSRGVTL